jgi:hypothetical protein
MKRTPLARRTPLATKKPLKARAPMKVKKRKAHTKAESEHLSRKAELCCLACEMDGHPDTPAAIHHPRHDEHGLNYGTGGRAPHERGFPLCEGHHQGDFDTTKVAIHRNPIEFEAHYGTEESLVLLAEAKLRGAA